MAALPIKDNNSSKYSNRFHISIAPVLALPQIFGLLPITGIFSRSTDDIKFKLISLRTLNTIVWFIGAIVFVFLALFMEFTEQRMNVKFMNVILYYSIGFLSAILLVPIAYKWNKLVQLFKGLDDIFCNNPYALLGWSLKTRIRVLTFTLVLLAMIEHLLFWYSFLYDRFVQAQACNWAIESWITYIASYHLSFVFRLLPIRESTAIWAEYMNISFTFVWHYIDLFIMAISISIATKFKMINQRLEYYKGTVGTKEFWNEIRLHYNKVCELNDYVCELFGSLICCACLSDLFSICITVYNAATYNPSSNNTIYFLYSTIYIMCRTFAMYLITASINDESIKPLKVFRTIPSDGWILEVQRLSDQVHQSNIALSGKNFFYLTRGIIIPIIGTIITYELVMIQFGGDSYYEKFDDCRSMGYPFSNQNSTLN